MRQFASGFRSIGSFWIAYEQNSYLYEKWLGLFYTALTDYKFKHYMKNITKHVIIPTIAPAIFFLTASLPVELLGCRNRGLIVASVAVAAGIGGIVAAVKALKGKMREDANSSLWMASALILAIPAIYIVVSEV
jgi:hypothetical protein